MTGIRPVGQFASMFTPVLGRTVTRWNSLRSDIIGEVGKTPNGNVYVRVGDLAPNNGWEQRAYVVLTPDETRLLRDSLTELLDGR